MTSFTLFTRALLKPRLELGLENMALRQRPSIRAGTGPECAPNRLPVACQTGPHPLLRQPDESFETDKGSRPAFLSDDHNLLRNLLTTGMHL